MIKLTKENIDKAIENKGNDIVKKNKTGYILTDETICTFNSLIVFEALFNNKCKMLNNALENLYYIADKLMYCGDDDEGGGDEPTPQDKYYSVTVSSNRSDARLYIGGIERSFASYKEGTRNIELRATCEGYRDLAVILQFALEADYSYHFEFTNDDKLTEKALVNVNVVENLNGQKVSVGGAQVRITGLLEGENKVYNTNSGTLDVGCNVVVHVTPPSGYESVSDYTFVLPENGKNVEIILTRIVITNRFTVTVNSNQNDSNIRIGDNIIVGRSSSVIFEEGTRNVQVQVTKEGYTSYSETIPIIDSDKTINAVLEQITPDTAVVNVTTYPTSANVVIHDLTNGIDYNTKQKVFNVGTRVSITASLEGYHEYNSDVRTLTEDWNPVINLQEIPEEYYTIDVSAIDSVAGTLIQDANIRIEDIENNRVYMNTGQFKDGTRLRIVASADRHFDNSMNYTVDKNEAVGNIITKQMQLEPTATLRVRVWSNSSHTIPLINDNLENVELVDTTNQQRLSPDAINNNVLTFNDLHVNRQYNVIVPITGYTQQEYSTVTINSVGMTIDIYMQVNTHKFKVIVQDADNNNVPIQTATVLVNGNQINYSAGQSEEIDVAYGTELEIEASATSYNSATEGYTMGDADYTMYIRLSVSSTTLTIRVVDESNQNIDITQYCTIKINNITGNNQTITPGSTQISVECNSPITGAGSPDAREGYVPFNTVQTFAAGVQNYTVILKPYRSVTANFTDADTGDPVVVNASITPGWSGEIVTNNNSTIKVKVPYGEDTQAIVTAQYYNNGMIEEELCTGYYEFDVTLTKSHVRLTFEAYPNGTTIWYNSRTNVVTSGYVMVPKNTPVTFGAYKTGYLDYSDTGSYSRDATIEIELQSRIRIHVNDSNGDPITGATIRLNTQGSSVGNIYTENGGTESQPGVYVVDYYDGDYTVAVDKSTFISKTQNFSVLGEKDVYITLADSTVTLTVNVRNKKTSATINNAEYKVDDVTISGYTAGFGKVQRTVNIRTNTTELIELSDTIPVQFVVYKNDLSSPANMQGVTIKYSINGVEYNASQDPDNPIYYDMPYNTDILYTGSAQDYETKSNTGRINDTSTAASAIFSLSLNRLYTLTINVVDSVSGELIDDANVTFTEQ